MTDVTANIRTDPEARSPAFRILKAAWARREFKIAAAVFALLLVMIAVAPLLLDTSATKMNVADKFLPPVKDRMLN